MEERRPRFSSRCGPSLVTVLLCILAGACMQPGDGPFSADAPFDVLITNARVVDGAGNAWFRADVGVRGDRIAAVGRLSGRAATRTIDAGDRVVTPGFVDMMGQGSLVLITDPPSAESKLRQGITTYLSGKGARPRPKAPKPCRIRPSSAATRCAGAGTPSISPSSRATASPSTWCTTSVSPRCAAWCWAMRMSLQRPSSSRKCGSWCARGWRMEPSACPLLSSIRPPSTRAPRSSSH